MHVSDYTYHSDLSGGFDVHLYQRLVNPFTRAPHFHCHPEFEIALFRAGTGIYHVGGEQYPIKPGDVFLFASNEPHFIIRIDPNEKMLILNFHFTRNFVCPAGSDPFDRQYLDVFVNRGGRFKNRIDGGEPVAGMIGDTLLGFENLFSERGGQALPLVKARLLTMLAEMLSMEDFAPGRESVSVTPSMDKLELATAYIEAHLTQQMTLEEIAQQAGMSRAYFSTVFKRAYGITLWEYIVAKRIQFATKLLRDRELTILDVALQSGFNNTTNFNRAFRKLTGRTPSVYQQEALRVPDAPLAIPTDTDALSQPTA